MPRVEYFFRETAAGLRRNGVVAFAAMSTAFIALFLFGLSLLIAREFALVTRVLTGNVEVQVYLTDPVNQGTVSRLTEALQDAPAVASVEYWNKQRSCQEFVRLFENQPVFVEQVDCEEVIPTSLRVKLADVANFQQVTAALGCEIVTDAEGVPRQQCAEPGIRSVADYTKLLERLDSLTRVLSLSVFGIAAIMLASAIGLVANTLRMGMFARRKEIGIMRLVGATNWRIRVPFLIEGLVEALLGAAAAIAGLFLVKVFVVDNLRGTAPWLPLIKNGDIVAVMPWILLAAAFVAIVAGTIGMRRFLDV
ncbi:MAG TPA: permease-like cell division protein FtsX [Actinomycetota bacterium]|nr:permease-like cell division protein FtsX [Actinomycetota bacterium]